MILYHNANIIDLNSIVSSGLLPASATGNDNWCSGKRANNSKDVVYLFDPLGQQNSFVNYGAALIEVDAADAELNDMDRADRNNGKYLEYVVPSVLPDHIKHIYIPAIFRKRISGLSQAVLEKVIWCKISAEVIVDYIPNPDDRFGFGGRLVYAPISAEQLNIFAATAELDVRGFNYFRGVPSSGEAIALYNVIYVKSRTSTAEE